MKPAERLEINRRRCNTLMQDYTNELRKKHSDPVRLRHMWAQLANLGSIAISLRVMAERPPQDLVVA